MSFGPYTTLMLENFKLQFSDVEITDVTMENLFGGGDATTVGNLNEAQLLQYAFATVLLNNEELLKRARIDQLKAGVSTGAALSRFQRRHGGR